MGNSIDLVKEVSEFLPNKAYKGNLVATEQLMSLLSEKSDKPLVTSGDYLDFYNDNCLTYTSWKKLVESEKEESSPLTEEELLNLIGFIIYKLPCGWFVWFI
ncbi:MAG: hypothetical protein OSJ43_06730 [Oscillospiraceae bacterium]|nr:hypothetical protein [Oscillospiraceae bacterium]